MRGGPRLRAVARFALTEFGPIIGFGLLAAIWGVKVAIAGSIAIILVDTAWRRIKRVPLTRTYVLFSGLTLVFGLVDLVAVEPMLLKFESVLTNLVTAATFALGARGRTPLLQQFAEQRAGAPLPARADVRRFFQLFTLAWAAYFVLKALFYLWVALSFPLAQAVAIRSVVGSLSFALLLAVSVTQGRRLFDLCQRLRLLPPVPTREEGAEV
jgi:intracellular septation protein A